MTIDTIKIIERLKAIESRMEELKTEAPILAKFYDNAKLSGNKAQEMLCEITMVSRLNETNELMKEVDQIKRSLGIF